MESKRPFDLEDPHKKAQDAIDHAREVREEKIADHKKTATEPHLITDGNLKRCSVCGYPFPADVHPSMSVATSLRSGAGPFRSLERLSVRPQQVI